MTTITAGILGGLEGIEAAVEGKAITQGADAFASE
jgi:hypothetical protein